MKKAARCVETIEKALAMALAAAAPLRLWLGLARRGRWCGDPVLVIGTDSRERRVGPIPAKWLAVGTDAGPTQRPHGLRRMICLDRQVCTHGRSRGRANCQQGQSYRTSADPSDIRHRFCLKSDSLLSIATMTKNWLAGQIEIVITLSCRDRQTRAAVQQMRDRCVSAGSK